MPAFATRAFASGDDTIRIGWVGPRSGPLGIFGEADAWLTEHFSEVNAGGIEIGGKTYGFEVILADTQSDPVRASQVTKDLDQRPRPRHRHRLLDPGDHQPGGRCLRGGGRALRDHGGALGIVVLWPGRCAGRADLQMDLPFQLWRRRLSDRLSGPVDPDRDQQEGWPPDAQRCRWQRGAGQPDAGPAGGGV